jgi:hypothetical protein
MPEMRFPRFRLARSQFYPFEEAVIEAVQARLSSESRAVSEQQFHAVNKVQRLANGKEVNLYRMRHGKADFADVLRYPRNKPEELLAVGKIVHPTSRQQMKFEVWLANGRIFSILFDQVPQVFFGGDVKEEKTLIEEVRIVTDPMQATTSEGAWQEADLTALRGYLQQWKRIGIIKSLRAPLPSATSAKILDSWDTVFPSDYLDFVLQADGGKLGACTAYPLSDMKRIVLPHQTFLALARVDERGELAVKQGDKNGDLYFLSYENDLPQRVGTSFKHAIEMYCRET